MGDLFDRAAEAFGYDAAWRDLLDDEFLELQLLQRSLITDGEAQHYRSAAFAQVLHQAESLDDGPFAIVLDLAIAELDTPLGTAALLHLARWPGLSADQRTRMQEQSTEWPEHVVAALTPAVASATE